MREEQTTSRAGARTGRGGVLIEREARGVHRTCARVKLLYTVYAIYVWVQLRDRLTALCISIFYLNTHEYLV